MKRNMLIPILILLVIPALACETVIGAFRPKLPIPELPDLTALPPDLATALPSLLEGTPPANLPPEIASAIPSNTGEVPPDIPVAGEPKDVAASQFLVSYTTSLGFDEVAQFYADQMPANGWKKDAAPPGLQDFVVQNYTKDNRTATVTISSAEGQTAVIIVLGER